MCHVYLSVHSESHIMGVWFSRIRSTIPTSVITVFVKVKVGHSIR